MKLISSIFFSLSALVASAQSPVDAVLQTYKADKDLQHASFSFCILDAQTGKVIQEYNAETSLVPASTLKIVTTSAALGILGKNYTYKTKIYASEKTDSITGLLNGSIVIKGSGDPTLNSQYFKNTADSDVVETWARKLKAKGIKQVKGAVLADATVFDNDIPGTWIWADIGNYFGAGANGLSYNDNKYALYYNTGGAGSAATLQSIRPQSYGQKLQISSEVLAAGNDDNAFIYGDPESHVRRVSGSIPPNRTNYEVEGQLADPAGYCAEELQQALTRQGVVFPKTAPVTTDAKALEKYLLYTHTSPPLDKIVYYTNTKSNNHYAETLLKTLGAAKSNGQGTTSNGIDAVIAYWKGRGVDVAGLYMSDGSGLSRANSITTRTQATILSKIYRDSVMYPVFNASLPIAGRNGSMTSLCKGTFAEGNLRAKTGYITRARGYCGYVKTKKGKELAFSILFNNYACSPTEMKQKIERFLVALTEL